ncbi:hypothetical protein GGS23DRAFT_560712 [Durotheca rogersii]|uniref:uncharacterized protein n=1 Tax=Durotheca rogersii TaxID=419775 RepID=UPI00221F0800|nr:uncharacterized protein GGS23DRAFT_560712 [Durotheca rogersii]KAI5864553.1 hypothetical protein GGS23DRAFT_560712 [Durotheca rogersii]
MLHTEFCSLLLLRRRRLLPSLLLLFLLWISGRRQHRDRRPRETNARPCCSLRAYVAALTRQSWGSFLLAKDPRDATAHITHRPTVRPSCVCVR